MSEANVLPCPLTDDRFFQGVHPAKIDLGKMEDEMGAKPIKTERNLLKASLWIITICNADKADQERGWTYCPLPLKAFALRLTCRH